MQTPEIVSPEQWEAARAAMLVKEKEFTRARDELAAQRRRMPWTIVDKAYRFEGPDGPATLLDLFAGRRQLIVYRAFLDPGTGDWPEHGCVGCSLMADHVPHLAHLNARDTSLVYVSRGSQSDLARIKARMGWDIPWYTIIAEQGSGFDVDFGVDQWHGTNAFIRWPDDAGVAGGESVYRTYFVDNRGDEAFVNTWNYLDITALGRQEAWEDSPPGYPQSAPYAWWRWHDAYGPTDPHDPGHLAHIYCDTRERVVGLLSGADAARWQQPVPACPGWSVRDVVAHLTAVALDLLDGTLSIPPSDAETAEHVRRFDECDENELLTLWADAADRLVQAARTTGLEPPLGDIACHEHDIRSAIGKPGARDAASVRWTAEQVLAMLDPPVPLRVLTEHGEYRSGPPQGSEIELRTTTFETLRWGTGRRSRAQLAAMDWSADPTPVLDHLYLFGPAAHDIVE